MSQNDDDSTADERQDGVGSVGEEAAKLFGALADWAKTQQPAEAGAQAGADAGHHLADALRNVNEHVAGDDCRFCPVCQVIHAVRETSPEVKDHLASAAGSFMQAVAGLLATPVPRPGDAGVEKIDLDDETEF